MLKGKPILVGVVLLVIASLFMFFKLRSIRHYSCTDQETGDVFSLKIQKSENIAHVKMEDKKQSINTSCQPIQGKENTYKCHVKEFDRKDDELEGRGYLILEEEDKNLRLYPGAELVKLTGEEFLGIFGLTKEDVWKIACRQAGGKILAGMLCVMDKPFATCERKNVLVSYIQEIFK